MLMCRTLLKALLEALHKAVQPSFADERMAHCLINTLSRSLPTRMNSILSIDSFL